MVSNGIQAKAKTFRETKSTTTTYHVSSKDLKGVPSSGTVMDADRSYPAGGSLSPKYTDQISDIIWINWPNIQDLSGYSLA